MSKRGVGRVFFYLYLLFLHALLIYLALYWVRSQYEVTPFVPAIKLENPTPAPLPTDPPATPWVEVTETPTPTASLTPGQSRGLIIPVQGVKPEQLTDTYTASRANGRAHDAIDIPAPGGTPVLAAASGKVAKFFDSVPGGITIYILGEDGRYMYYYAHLQRRADDLKEGDHVDQGRVIAYVGDTGNAGPGNTHLHFSIAQVNDPKRFWEGTYLNPYPLLKSGTAPQ